MFTEGDIDIIRGNVAGSYQAEVDDRSTSGASATLKPGEPVKRDNANFCLLVADGDPEVGTDVLPGIASSESTETSSADGTVSVDLITPSTVLRGFATTSGNISTSSELQGVKFDYVAFDVDGSNNVTIDEDEGDDPNVHGLCILDGDIVDGTLDVIVNIAATISGSHVGQNMD